MIAHLLYILQISCGPFHSLPLNLVMQPLYTHTTHTHTHTAVINHIATPGCEIPVAGLHMDENTAGALHQYSRIALCVETRACCILIQGPAQKCINGFLPF